MNFNSSLPFALFPGHRKLGIYRIGTSYRIPTLYIVIKTERCCKLLNSDKVEDPVRIATCSYYKYYPNLPNDRKTKKIMPPNPLQPASSLYDLENSDDSDDSHSLGLTRATSSRNNWKSMRMKSSIPTTPLVEFNINYHSTSQFNSLNGDVHPAPKSSLFAASTKLPNRGLEVDDMLSKEMLDLSFSDRNAISEEIHGVCCLAPRETPELLSVGLVELQRELDAMPYKPAYDKAQAYAQLPKYANTSYVNTPEFRLKFLRCELFDARKAAIRLTKFLELMVELYGLFALQRKVQLKDFSKHEMQIVRAGYFQTLPFRDRSGRRIMCIVSTMGIEYDPMLRVSKTIFVG